MSARPVGISVSAARAFIVGELPSIARVRLDWQTVRPPPKNPANQTPPEIVEKVLHLRQTYHLGPIRIVWYLARYHNIKISDAGVYRILKRNGLSKLPSGTRVRKVHTKRYEQQVPGHQIQVDVKFLTLQAKDGR